MKLKHDNDPLAEHEKFLANVEVVLKHKLKQFMQLETFLMMLANAEAQDNVNCLCGFPIRRQDLRYYADHDGGLAVPGETTKCWIYSHCPKCGYDNSWVKILRQLESGVGWHRGKG